MSLIDDLNDLDKFYKFDLLSCTQSKYYKKHKLFRGNYTVSYTERPLMTVVVFFNDKLIKFEYIPFIIIFKQYFYQRLINNLGGNPTLYSDIINEIKNKFGYTVAETTLILDRAYDRVEHRARRGIGDPQIDRHIGKGYENMFDLNFLKFMLKQDLFSFSSQRVSFKSVQDLYILSRVEIIKKNVSFNFITTKTHGKKEFNALKKYFFKKQKLIEIMDFSFEITSTYPTTNHSNLSFGETMLNILSKYELEEYDFTTEKFDKQIENIDEQIENIDHELTQLTNTNNTDNTDNVVKNIKHKRSVRTYLESRRETLVYFKASQEERTKQAYQKIRSDDNVYPFYIFYNDLRDIMETNDMFSTKRNTSEFLDNDLHEFYKTVRNAANHKKRYLNSIIKDMNIIKECKKKSRYVDNKDQLKSVQNKLDILKAQYNRQVNDYETFDNLIKNFLFDKSIQIPSTLKNQLKDLLAEETEIFYNYEKNIIDLLVHKGIVLYLNFSFFFLIGVDGTEETDPNSQMEIINSKIKRAEDSIIEMEVEKPKQLKKIKEIHEKLYDVYEEILKIKPTYTFANTSSPLSDNFDRFLDFE